MSQSAQHNGRLSGRIAVITGASRGIGRSVALAYASAGAHTILVARTVGGLEEVDDEIRKIGGRATLVSLDLTDFEALDRLGAQIFERWGKLDILVGNGGILGSLTPIPHIEPKEWQGVLDVNLTANWRLIRSLDPLLKKSDAGRVIFVSSGVAQSHKAYWATYAISKAALEALANIYAAENANTNVKTNIINPGGTRTRMRTQAFPGEDPLTLPHPDELVPLFLELAEPASTRNGERIDFQHWASHRN